MHGLSPDALEKIAKKRLIKNYEDMKKENLIISLSKSKEIISELFNDNNNNEISDVRKILRRLREIFPKKDRKEIKDKLYKIKHQRNISEAEKEENDKYLRKIVRILNDKEEYSLYDGDDFDYYGIRDIEHLFNEDSEENYYKPIFVKSSHKGNYKHYESNGDIEKKLSVKQYLNKTTPYLYDLINDHRIARRVWKIQINIHVNFISSKGTG